MNNKLGGCFARLCFADACRTSFSPYGSGTNRTDVFQFVSLVQLPDPIIALLEELGNLCRFYGSGCWVDGCCWWGEQVVSRKCWIMWLPVGWRTFLWWRWRCNHLMKTRNRYFIFADTRNSSLIIRFHCRSCHPIYLNTVDVCNSSSSVWIIAWDRLPVCFGWVRQEGERAWGYIIWSGGEKTTPNYEKDHNKCTLNIWNYRLANNYFSWALYACHHWAIMVHVSAVDRIIKSAINTHCKRSNTS